MCEVAFGITAMVRFRLRPHAVKANPASAGMNSRLLFRTPAAIDQNVSSRYE
jgi:hypothetical protein